MHKALFHTEHRNVCFSSCYLKRDPENQFPFQTSSPSGRTLASFPGSTRAGHWVLQDTVLTVHKGRRVGQQREGAAGVQSQAQRAWHNPPCTPTKQTHACISVPLFLLCFFHIYFSCDRRKISLKNIKLVQFEVEMFSLTQKQAGLMPGFFNVCLDQDSSTV